MKILVPKKGKKFIFKSTIDFNKGISELINALKKDN